MDVSLGQGNQGEVIKVKSYKNDIEYAMKVVEAFKMKNRGFADQIIQETLLLNSLNHENIIKVIDFFKVKNGDFISIMEYQDSYDLHKIVTKPEKIQKKHKKFADKCYQIHDGEMYLKEDFIVNVIN